MHTNLEVALEDGRSLVGELGLALASRHDDVDREDVALVHSDLLHLEFIKKNN